MDLRIKIKKPHSDAIDAALRNGVSEIRAAPGGLYLRRLQHQLDGAIDVKPIRPGTMVVIRSEFIMEKEGESRDYGLYRRKKIRWTDLL